ncbi:hypothetical protein D6856_13915 [Butyrivibrio sp. XB500-5]|uniref:hypothetical protein n=1 Tax=Butyrivibrio sp. XB500-5 TaxID=2364880 RepID=UPI000EAA86C6|nr:hypothetical protein [Butyrivibrio sp. XB500-5]RKM57747.1 hypothetical protein D6856_13915 [Butyrivibrio sp. XB500-5]
MNKRLLALMFAFFLMGCANMNTDEKTESDAISSVSDSSSNETSVIEEEDVMLKACFGTVKEINGDVVTIEGVNSKKYIGDIGKFEKLDEGTFVYFEFSSYEETEEGINVEFTIFREQSRDPNSSDYKVIN